MSQSSAFRAELRITRYDPDLRDRHGAFGGDDWSSVSDVGGVFGGRRLALPDYLKVEAQHLRVVAAFLDEASVEAMTAHDVESYSAHWWPREGEALSALECVDLVREMLRERGFCRLHADSNDVYVHVGYDYYLYLGGKVACHKTLRLATAAGLFVDQDFRSPYHVDPETGEYD